jgi:parallel beta-helix repeat protein
MCKIWFKVLVVLMLVGVGVVSSYGIPFELKYQGYLEVGGVPYTGVATTYYSLLDNISSPTTNYWTNDNSQPSPGDRPLSGVAVTVNNGVYNLNLGDTTLRMFPLYSTVFKNDPVYLRVWYKAGSNSVVQLVPDERIASAGYALNAARLAGLAVGHGIKSIPVNDYSFNTGLNADILDNQQGSYYRNAGNLNAGVVPSGRIVGSYSGASVDYSNWAGNASSADNAISASSASYASNADQLDGLHATDFAKPLYDAIVALTNGDYTTISAALDAGKKTIFVKNGTYPISSQINITQDGIAIIGESRQGVILDHSSGSGSYCFYFKGNAGSTVISGSTCIVTQGSANATIYSNASFSVSTMKWYIRIDDRYYAIKIASGPLASPSRGEVSLTPPTQYVYSLTLDSTYFGHSTTTNYLITTYLENARLENLTIQGGYTGVYFQWVKGGIIRNCEIKQCDYNAIYLNYAIENLIENNQLNTNGGAGINLYQYSDYNTMQLNKCIQNGLAGMWISDQCCHNRIDKNNVYGNAEGIVVLYSSNYNSITGNDCSQNEGPGLELDNQVYYAYINDNVCNGNNNCGIYCNISTANLIITNNISMYNTYYGLVLYNGVEHMMIANNRFEHNAWYGISINQSNDNTVSGNACNYNGFGGIYVDTSNRNRITANGCSNNGFYGIVLYSNSDNNSITNCNADNNAGYGIRIDNASCDNTIILGCQISGNTSTNLSDAGTNTQKGYNYAP